MQAEGNDASCNSHRRSIFCIHTDLLSYLPEVGSKPAGLRWDEKIVASNAVARSYGVSEPLPVTTALKLCPDLYVLNSEVMAQLTDMVNQIDSVLQNCSLTLERVGLNECYLDVTKHPHLANAESRRMFDTSCSCGCLERISAARNIAFQLLVKLSSEIPIHFKIGVSSSKLLARLAAVQAKDDECHAVAPEDAVELLQFLDNRLILPGSLGTLLVRKGWKTAGDIRTLTMNELSEIVGVENAEFVMSVAYGEDHAEVVPSNSWQLFCLEFQIWEKYFILLHRLLAQVEEVGCIPLTVRVSVRKQDPARGTCSKESKSALIPGGMIVPNRRMPRRELCQFMGVIMSLFRRIVDTSRPFQLSLLGLAFDRFHEAGQQRMRYPSAGHHLRTVASCLMRKREYSVEVPFSAKFEGETCLGRQALPNVEDTCELSDRDLTPRKKKAKLDVLIHTKKISSDLDMDLCSLSKLRVAELKLSDDLGKRLKC